MWPEAGVAASMPVLPVVLLACRLASHTSKNAATAKANLAELMAQADFRYFHKSYSEGFQAWRSYSDMCADSAEK